MAFLHNVGARAAVHLALREEAFRVLAVDDEIDLASLLALERCQGFLVKPHWPDTLVQVEFLANVDLRGHLGAVGASAHPGRPIAPSRIASHALAFFSVPGGSGVAGPQVFPGTDGKDLEVEHQIVRSRFYGPQDPDGGIADLGSDSVPREQRDSQAAQVLAPMSSLS